LAIKKENILDHKERHRENFLRNHKPKFTGDVAPTSARVAKIWGSNVNKQSQPVPEWRAPSSQYERDLQNVLKESQQQKHASGLSYQMLLDFSSRELTPEDYEMLLLLDSVVEKKTTSDSVLKSLVEKEVDLLIIGSNCPICVCDFESGEKAITLNCTHVFHAGCITEWLTKHSQTCPMCKEPVCC